MLAYRVDCQHLWLKAGIGRNKKYVSVKEVARNIPQQALEHIMAFHALHDSDKTSYIRGHSKKTALSVWLGKLSVAERFRQGQTDRCKDQKC